MSNETKVGVIDDTKTFNSLMRKTKVQLVDIILRKDRTEAELSKTIKAKNVIIDKTQQELGKGTQRYGASSWKKWESGSEKGLHRSFYVDIKSMITSRAT